MPRISVRRFLAVILLSALTLYVLLVSNLRHDASGTEESSNPQNRINGDEVGVKFNGLKYYSNVFGPSGQLSSDFYPVESDIWMGNTFDDQRIWNKHQMITIVLMDSVIYKYSDIKCTFKSAVVAGRLYEMCENHEKRFGGYFIICPIPDGYEDEADFQISISHARAYSASPIVTLFNETSQLKQPQHNFSICVPPLFGEDYTFENLVEFMELSYSMGADHVFLYVDSSAKERFESIIKYYISIGFVTAVWWNIPGGLNEEKLHYKGQILAIQDCLYRSSGRSKYVVFHDLDELFVSKSNSWRKDISPMFQAKSELAGLGIPTRYFPVKDRTFPISSNNLLKTSKVDIRLTKCIVRPERIFEMGIHHVSKPLLDAFTVERMKPSTGQLFHFKNCRHKRNDDICHEHYLAKDRTLAKYSTMLQERHAEVSNILEENAQ